MSPFTTMASLDPNTRKPDHHDGCAGTMGTKVSILL